MAARIAQNCRLLKFRSLANLRVRNFSKELRHGFIGMVGNTPLIRFNKLSEKTGLIRPGGTVVEGTAGNTGIGLAHICLAKGYKCVIYMPNTQSQEKIDVLKTLGADVHPVPAVPFDDPMNYNHQARRFAESIDNAVWTNQFDNISNRRAHFEMTGPEIWNQTDGRIDAVTFSTGTGGTLAGDDTSFLLIQNSSGIGQGRVTSNLNGAPIDDAVFVTDKEAVEMVAEMLGPGHVITTCLCDTGQKYFARLFSKDWMESKGLLDAIPEKYRHSLH
ncbi:hypothetical protein pdam_00023035 [Pocillopora damicornis]|uniref:Cysteine synthase 1 n=1 Tax=Pocillopora damicornis TaxID=46731 RepID=A0A3M6UJL8_POCDA|nr:hypothetical protein pdam_00023035 [Pocillopora damicornis]